MFRQHRPDHPPPAPSSTPSANSASLRSMLVPANPPFHSTALPPCKQRVSVALYFQALPNASSRNPFPFIFLQTPIGVFPNTRRSHASSRSPPRLSPLKSYLSPIPTP